MADVLLTHSYHLPYDPKQVRKMQPYAPLGTLYAASALRAGDISVAVAWMVGGIELLQVLAAKLSLHGGLWAAVESIDLGQLGYIVVALFAAMWLLSLTVWKTARIEIGHKHLE